MFEEREVEFSLGEGEVFGVVEGVEIALKRFLNEEKSKLLIKSKYAFKEQGKAEFNIPPNADVEYEVELKNFEKVCTIFGFCESIFDSFTTSSIIDYCIIYLL